MPEMLCPKCGAAGREADLFCRNCGADLSANPESSSAANPDQNVIWQMEPSPAPRQADRSRRSCCLFSAVAGVFFIITLTAAALLFFANQPGGLAAVKIEVVGSPTPYPTRTPYPTPTVYRTASPYRTQAAYPTTTVYPTQAIYPTTGAIRGPRPTGVLSIPRMTIPMLGGCRVNIRNQNAVQDAVVILSAVENGTSTASAYIRAGEAYSTSGIGTGTYHIYVTIGQNWDSAASRFSQNAFYFRFEDPTVFTSCPSGFYGSYQYLDITLALKEGPGTDTLSVAPENFPVPSP